MSRRAGLGLALLGAAVYTLALVATLPAAHALAWADPAGIEVDGAAGSIWAGTAERVVWRREPGLPVLTEVGWDLAAWRLLTGRLQADVRANAAGLEIDGRVGTGRDGELRLSGLALRGPVGPLLEQAPLPVAASGTLLARIERARLVAGQPRDVRGRAVWSGARLQAPLALSLGDVLLEVEPADGSQRARISAQGGELAINGNARLQADGRWQLDLNLVPSAQAGERLHKLLTLMGAREDGQGNYRLRRSGSL